MQQRNSRCMGTEDLLDDNPDSLSLDLHFAMFMDTLASIMPSNSTLQFNDSFVARMISYENTLDHNDAIHVEFTKRVAAIPFLHQHRQHIETNRLGFGDAAFHYLWYLLIQHIAQAFPQPKVLEIGVYKGQVISLWKLLESQLQLNLEISAISPLKGNPLPRSPWIRRWKQLVNPQFRWSIDAGSIYPEDDYQRCIEKLFAAFNLNLSDIDFVQGYSTDPEVVEKFRTQTFPLIYIDGDHTYEAVEFDIANYAPRVAINGFLVMDDAAYYRPGSVFWKGHETVSRACELNLPQMGFINVFNVGHNRVYRRIY